MMHNKSSARGFHMHEGQSIHTCISCSDLWSECFILPWEHHIGRDAREMNSLRAYWSVTWGGKYATKHFSDNAIYHSNLISV